MTRYTEPSVVSCDDHIERSSGNPWSKTTTGPGPLSLYARSIGMAPREVFRADCRARPDCTRRPTAWSIHRARALADYGAGRPPALHTRPST